jgi:hypothetical protein
MNNLTLSKRATTRVKVVSTVDKRIRQIIGTAMRKSLSKIPNPWLTVRRVKILPQRTPARISLEFLNALSVIVNPECPAGTALTAMVNYLTSLLSKVAEDVGLVDNAFVCDECEAAIDRLMPWEYDQRYKDEAIRMGLLGDDSEPMKTEHDTGGTEEEESSGESNNNHQNLDEGERTKVVEQGETMKAEDDADGADQESSHDDGGEPIKIDDGGDDGGAETLIADGGDNDITEIIAAHGGDNNTTEEIATADRGDDDDTGENIVPDGGDNYAPESIAVDRSEDGEGGMHTVGHRLIRIRGKHAQSEAHKDEGEEGLSAIMAEQKRVEVEIAQRLDKFEKHIATLGAKLDAILAVLGQRVLSDVTDDADNGM